MHHHEREDVGHVRQTPHGQGALLQGLAAGLGLEKDEVGPAFHQALGLLDDHPFNQLFVLGLRRQRSDRTGHEDRPVRGAGHFLGDPHAGPVDRGELLRQPKLGQRDLVGPEGVGCEHVGPGVAVVGVDLPDQGRVRQVELVERAVGENVVPVDFRAHGPVEDHDALAQGLLEAGWIGHDANGLKRVLEQRVHVIKRQLGRLVNGVLRASVVNLALW